MNSFEKRIEEAKLNNIIQENEIINTKTINKERLKVFIDLIMVQLQHLIF
jgi:hypothetical protein